MTRQQLKKKYAAWKQAKAEAWSRAWEFADAVVEYAQEKPRGYTGDIAADTGLSPDYIRTIKMTASVYSSTRRNPEASFRSHMEFARTGRGGEWVPDGTTLRDVNVPEADVKTQLQNLPPAEAVTIVAEVLDTPPIIEVLKDDDDAVDHVFHAFAEATPKRGPSNKPPRTRIGRTMDEMELIFDLMGVLGRMRDLARENADSPLLISCKELMRETLEILDGLKEASDPAVVEEMFSDFENLLASQ